MRFKPPIDGIVAGIGSLFGLNKGKGQADANGIDVDDEGKVLFKEEIIQKVLDDLEKRKTERSIL